MLQLYSSITVDRAENTRDKHKQVMVIKRPLFPICFSCFYFYRTGNTYDKFVVSYLVPLITLYGSPTFVHTRVKKSLWATFVSSQGLKHAIHSRHKYWHEHAHHDTRHEVTQLEDAVPLSSDASKDGEEKKVGWRRKKQRVWGHVSDERWRALGAQDGWGWGSCMFGSIQRVHVVNMKAVVLLLLLLFF